MYELIQAAQNSYYIQCPAKIGLVRLNETDVALIDSGSDKDAGRRVRQILDAHGWRLTAIYNTHSHADHIGGNKYLQAQTGCKIYAPGMECAFTRHPVLEPSFLWGGCPPDALRHKFLMAQPSDAACLTPAALPAGWQIVPLPGHAFDMVGFRTPDDAVYLADCLSSRETLDKYGVGYIWDVGAYLETLQAVQSLTAGIFIPSHADAASDIAPLAQYNADKVLQTAEKILAACAVPTGFETLLQQLFEDFGLRMDMQQYALVGSTLRSYLAWLHQTGRLQPVFEANRLLWQRL